jgi:hypothetical protein
MPPRKGTVVVRSCPSPDCGWHPVPDRGDTALERWGLARLGAAFPHNTQERFQRVFPGPKRTRTSKSDRGNPKVLCARPPLLWYRRLGLHPSCSRREDLYPGIDRSSLLKEPLVASFCVLFCASLLDGLLPMLFVDGRNLFSWGVQRAFSSSFI